MGVKKPGRFCGARKGKRREEEGDATGGGRSRKGGESEGSGAGLLGSWLNVPEAVSTSLGKTEPRQCSAGTIGLDPRLYPGSSLDPSIPEKSQRQMAWRGGAGGWWW